MRKINRDACKGFFYKGKDEASVREFVHHKIITKRENAKLNGISFVYAKSRWFNDELLEELEEQDPDSPILKWNPIYRQQVISKAISECGMVRQGKSNRPLYVGSV